MKRWLIIVLGAVALLLLAVRGLQLHIGRARNERPQYVKSLGLHFSASVDSVRGFSPTNGLVFFHSSQREHYLFTENQMNKKLKVNGELRFLLPIDNKLAFHSRDMDKYKQGDSIVINCDEDKIEIFRQGKRVAESEISKALSGRPF